MRNKRIAAHLGLFAGVLAALWLLLMLSANIPNGALRANYEKSALRYKQTEAFAFCDGEKFNAIADHYADAIWLNVSWYMGEGDPLTATLDTRYYDGGEAGENVGLFLSVTEDAAANTDYSRYWHGSAMFFRLFHLFTDVNGIKLIGFAAVLVLLGVTAVLLFRKKHADIAALLVLSLCAVQFWNIRLSLEYQPAFVLTFVLCPLFLWLERRGDEWLSLLSVAGGAAIAFFDFLTSETLTILLPLLLVIAVRAKEGRLGPLRENLRLLLRCGLCWGAAYAGAFLVKWTAASLVTGENVFALALSSAAERIGGAVELTQEQPNSIFSALAANLTVLFGGTARVQAGRAALGSMFLLLVLFSVWYLFHAKKGDKTAAVLLLALGAVVFVRYLVLNNHSYLHEFFTYRALAAPVLALLLALRLNIERPQKKRVKK